MKRRLPRGELQAMELLEGAVHLLRLSPLSVVAIYYLGSLPFVLGFLFFWTDMSQSAFARQRMVPSAMGLGVLFLGMKMGQMLFVRQLLARISGRPPEPWKWHRLGQAVATQTLFQSTGLFLLPLALVLTLPFGWVYAFYQNATVLGGIETNLRSLRREASHQAQLWPAQNHLLLAFLSLGALFIFLNLGLAALMIPQLFKMLFGVETVFTHHVTGMFNSTFVAVLAGLTYLCLDPLAKAVYALRCFYGRSLESGEDLKVELRSLRGGVELVPQGPAKSQGEPGDTRLAKTQVRMAP